MRACRTCGCTSEHRKAPSRMVALMRFAHFWKGGVKYYDLRFDKKYRIPENNNQWPWIYSGFRADLKQLYKTTFELFLCGHMPFDDYFIAHPSKAAKKKS